LDGVSLFLCLHRPKILHEAVNIGSFEQFFNFAANLLKRFQLSRPLRRRLAQFWLGLHKTKEAESAAVHALEEHTKPHELDINARRAELCSSAYL
jgi:hypothetical protein